MNRAFKMISIIWQLIISIARNRSDLKKTLFYEKLKLDSLFIMGVKTCLKKNLAIKPVSILK